MTFRYVAILLLFTTILNATTLEEQSMKLKWERLFAYWADRQVEFWHDGKIVKFTKDIKCEGADTFDLEKIINFYENIPESFLESLSLCNESNRWFGFDSWGLLLGIEEIIEMSDSFKDSPSHINGSYQIVGEGITNPTMLLPKQWIPIYDWNGNYIVAIDMLSKNKGQIIVFCLEFSTVAKWTDSYEEWFELAVDEVLKYGELRVETIESVLQMPEE